jgi:hypothetical protein
MAEPKSNSSKITTKKTARTRSASSRPARATEKSSKSSVRKRASKKAVSSKKTSKIDSLGKSSEEEVIIPTSVPPRLIQWTHELRMRVHPGTFSLLLFAFVFMLLGASVASQGMADPAKQSATSVWQLFDSSATTPTAYEEPDLALLNDIPFTVQDRFKISFLLSNARYPSVALYSLSSGDKHALEVRPEGSDGVFSFDIPFDTLPEGEYRIKIFAKDLLGNISAAYTSNTFVVEKPDVNEPPVFNLNIEIPDLVTEDLEVIFTLYNAQQPKVEIYKNDQKINSVLPQLSVGSSPNVYEVLIPTANFTPGDQYWLKILAKDMNSSLVVIYESKQFTYNSESKNNSVPTDDITDIDISDNVIPSLDDPKTPIIMYPDYPHSDSEAVYSTTSSSVNTTLGYAPPAYKELQENEETPKEKELPVYEELYEDEDVLLTGPRPMLKLSVEAAVLSNNAQFIASSESEFSFAELHVRKKDESQWRFLQLGSKKRDSWIFTVDTTKLSNGSYQFFVLTKISGQEVRSKIIDRKIFNQVIQTTETPIPTPAPAVTQERPLLVVAPEVPERVETVVPVSQPESITATHSSTPVLTPTQPPPRQIELQPKRVANTMLRDTGGVTEKIFQEYTQAVIDNDVTKKEELSVELESYRESLVRDVSGTVAEEEATRVAEELALQIEQIKQQVERFESIRKAPQEQIAVDSDGDGISDTQEEVLYGTDPKKADSDDDGVSDADELVSGTDPLSNQDDAMLAYESPKETLGLNRDDVLAVEVVEQENELNVVSTTSTTTLVFNTNPVIKGRALPNTLVTVYVFSTPTIVTVKTDADGDFVYTFDKELPDGEHEVYVAVTDAKGGIVAQSNPFSFLKTAEAITPIASAQAARTTPDLPIDSVRQDYTIVFGIGIMVFGVLLLVVGVSFGSKSNKQNTGADFAAISGGEDGSVVILKDAVVGVVGNSSNESRDT